MNRIPKDKSPGRDLRNKTKENKRSTEDYCSYNRVLSSQQSITFCVLTSSHITLCLEGEEVAKGREKEKTVNEEKMLMEMNDERWRRRRARI